MNVAADPLFTAAYTGIRGGLVVINADDPQMHSSQNEQDNRNYAFAAKVPMLEPSDPSEAKEMLQQAFALSEQLDTPVLFRITTRIAHVKGVVNKGERIEVSPGSIEKMPGKFVMLPGNARRRRIEVEKRMAKARELAEKISKLSLTIAVEVNDLEKLYGSVTEQDIAKALEAEGYTIDKKDILIDHHIEELGIYEVKVKLHPEVETKFRLWVTKK